MLPHKNILIASAVSFVCGVAVASAYFVSARDSGSLNANHANGSHSTEHEPLPSTQISDHATDWTALVDTMCRPNSDINHLAMKLDFPFARCQDAHGTIDKACVSEDAKRFQPALPQPYQANLNGMTVRLDSADGWYDMHYILPLQNATYHGMPLQALAVNIEIGDSNSNEMRGWQTPYVVVQEDFSKIKSALAQNPPASQTVYYANVPESSNAQPEPFATEIEAQQASKQLGGNPDLVSKQSMKLEANFNERLKAVTLGCVSQSS
ncbi:hypothetical protein [Alysiella filiformis]|uniref:Uncharacterized protein n=1 Tax=Alysiella filiformis DSM 16848 TaxID=1120981 RepID=A0A286EFV7_9NEIS|nr:hypothetical protein [Alysiella filiformis]QMT30641.1 hypothetical protein H3L97_07750 [Alysiella filiformis]UBQ56382.1 hypothetical protein JF568_00940 [Alysiella filiformis DSM 16848]SOD69694.1 hypothetical protein SAMN02746062_01801 [Alysiella filiformis DSM 16848]